jgi:hypothetical protein
MDHHRNLHGRDNLKDDNIQRLVSVSQRVACRFGARIQWGTLSRAPLVSYCCAHATDVISKTLCYGMQSVTILQGFEAPRCTVPSTQRNARQSNYSSIFIYIENRSCSLRASSLDSLDNMMHVLNSVNQLIFVMVKCGVLFEVRTGFLNNIWTSFVFKGLNSVNQLIFVMVKCVVFSLRYGLDA